MGIARRRKMSKVEPTSAGLQIIIPGCERRTLQKSTTPVDESGQALLHFYKPPMSTKGQKASPKSGLFST
jgi:hypothetical protein